LRKKFLVGLPTLLGERVKNKIKDTFISKTIPYDQLTYEKLVGFTQKKKVLKIYQDLKLQKHLKWEMRRTRHELSSFHQQFDLSLPKLTCNGSYSKPTTSKPNKPPYKRITHKYKKHFYTKIEPYYKKTIKNPTKPFQSK
jgi:hypothetical protein